jgi:DNA repair exonuclease SbcCD nuclease subunit
MPVTAPWRILHTADLQLGYKQYGFADRLRDFNNAVGHVFNRGLALNVDIFNLAGDLFQMITPPGSCVAALQKNVFMALQQGKHVIGVQGNHDPADEPNAWLTTCGINPLDVGRPTILTFDDPAKGTLRIGGLNYYQTPTLLAKLAELVQYASQHGGMDVLVLHCSVAEMAGFRGVDLTAAQIAHMVRPVGCRCVLMGDIHDGKQLSVGGVMFTYSGSLEVTALNEDPHKVFNVINVTPTDIGIELHPIPTRPIVNHYVAKEEDTDKLLAELQRYAGHNPLFIVTYNPAIPNFQQRAKALLEGKALFRLIPTANPDTINVDILAQLSQQSFERKGALNNLRTILTDDFKFAEGSDEFILIMQMMEKPDDVTRVCLDYARSKGIQLVEGL